MSKWKLAIILALILGLVATIAAFAGGFSVVTYTDVTATGFDPGKTITTPQYINNGDFKNWTNGKPDGWNVPTKKPTRKGDGKREDAVWITRMTMSA